MQKITNIILTSTATMLLGLALMASPTVQAAGGRVPEGKVCNDKTNPPKDAVTQGGCIVIDRRKGNCMGCHEIAGTSAGNIATKMENMAQRWPDKAKLRAQIHDAAKFNPDTVMPPFGRHNILSADEIDKVVEFVLSL